MAQKIIPLIMCGGAGTRLWPASREVRPKQFRPLFGARSTFQDTLARVSDANLFDRPIVITNAAYRFMVLEQLAEIGIEANVLLEPARRDSGPAIAAGAAFAQTLDKDAVVLALAADHVVRDTPAFVAACRQGLVAAEAGRIVTFGIKPERPATEYGYINPGEAVAGEVRSIAKFVEKPDAAKAAEYIKAGYLWNSGNFMFQASLLLDEYRKFDASSAEAVNNSVSKAGLDLDFVTLDREAFGSPKAISIDYAVMEKTARAAVVPSPAAGPMSAPGTRCGNCLTRMRKVTPRRAGPCSRIRAIAMSRPTRRWWRSKASTTLWWWRPRTRSLCRGRRTPTA
jgi:mannose-1-phosphate guanylyltransferase / mannose-6-phosphate isomerase